MLEGETLASEMAEGETAEEPPRAPRLAFNLGPQFERARDETSVMREAVEGTQLQVTLVQSDLERFKSAAQYGGACEHAGMLHAPLMGHGTHEATCMHGEKVRACERSFAPMPACLSARRHAVECPNRGLHVGTRAVS